MEVTSNIIISEGVEKINDFFFSHCKNLEEIILPNTIKKIGEYAFSSTTLKRITIPEGVEEIGCSAFSNCENLEEVILPSTIKKIGNFAFSNTGIKSITIPEGVEEIGNYTFCDCNNLEEITLSSTIKRIEEGAFSNTRLKRITIPEGVEEIGISVFSNCENLEEVILPSTIKKIDRLAFNETSLKKIILSEVLEKIDDFFFSYCKNLKEVILPNTIKKIGEYAFSSTTLKRITIPEGVEEIGNYAFCDCNKLEKIILPSTIKKIGQCAFSNTRLKRITIPEGVEEIGASAFFDCSDLEEVAIPSMVKRIRGYAFAYSSLKRIVIPGVVEEINDSAFCDCNNLEEMEISCLSLNEYVKPCYTTLKMLILHYNSYKEIIASLNFFKTSNLPECIKIKFIGPKLSLYQSALIKMNILNLPSHQIDFGEENKKIENKMNSDSEIESRIKIIDELIKYYPEKYTNDILKEKEELLSFYFSGKTMEKPKLNFNEDSSISLKTQEIGFSKIEVLARLDILIMQLSSKEKSITKLKKYYQILEEDSIENLEIYPNPSTIEEIIANIKCILSLMNEEKKKKTLLQIKKILDDAKSSLIDSLEWQDFDDKLYNQFKELNNIIINDYYASYPFMQLLESFTIDGDYDVKSIEFLIFNFFKLIDKIEEKEEKEILSKKYEELKDKYTNIINTILETENFGDKVYQKLVYELRMEIHPLLESLKKVIIQEINKNDLNQDIKDALKKIKNNTSENRYSVISLFIKDIEDLLKNKNFDQEEISQTKDEMSHILEEYIERMHTIEDIKLIEALKRELYSKFASLYFNLVFYAKELEDYNKFYTAKKFLKK